MRWHGSSCLQQLLFVTCWDRRAFVIAVSGYLGFGPQQALSIPKTSAIEER